MAIFYILQPKQLRNNTFYPQTKFVLQFNVNIGKKF